MARTADDQVDKLTLREAADRTGLSITTLRRYIRSGRLAAEKAPGRYGPEYYLSMEALGHAGISASNGPRTLAAEDLETNALAAPANGGRQTALAHSSGSGGFFPESLLREAVPIDL